MSKQDQKDTVKRYLLTILVEKFGMVHSTTCSCLNIAVCRANSVDPDQTPHSAGLGLHCLPMPICPNIRVKTTKLTFLL